MAIDADRKQINVLDSKGYSLENIESSYSNAPDLKQQLDSLGKSLFGQEWSAQKNILQMNIPKQQGANDCGAFVCDFTKQLLEGKSVGDIERTFDAKQRSELRMQAAQTIKEGFLEGLDEDISFIREAAKANENMPTFLQSYIPFSEGLQKENSPILKGSAATPSPRAAASPVAHTDSPRSNPALYAEDPPFGTGGIVKGHYVQRQYGECCFAHALSAYCRQPVFESRDEFLEYRNPAYEALYRGILTEEGLEENKRTELTEVEAVGSILSRMQADPAKAHLRLSDAPWTTAILRGKDPGRDAQKRPLPIDAAGNKAKIDRVFAYYAQHSDSKRFIVRSGETQGHYQAMVYDPAKNPDAPWTLLNSTVDIVSGNNRLPKVKSGKSPSELLENYDTRLPVLGIWTQSNNPAANIGQVQLDSWVPPA